MHGSTTKPSIAGYVLRKLPGAAVAGPVLALRGAGLLAGATSWAVRGLRVAGNAVDTSDARWQSGRRLHVTVRERLPGAATILAKLAAQRDDVSAAHWDAGLGSVVLRLAEDAVADHVTDWLAERAESVGVVICDDTPHPGDVRDVRVAAGALAFDTAGFAVALAGRAFRPVPAAKWAEAAVSTLREHPDVRAALAARLGPVASGLLLAGVNAAARGLASAPAPLALDMLLRCGQLAEAVARVSAFDVAHDQLVDSGRPVLHERVERPAFQRRSQSYARSSVAGGALGALAAMLVRGNARAGAEAVLAASPLAARCGTSAFESALGWSLAHHRILVCSPDRLAALDAPHTVVLHTGALGGRELDPHAEAVLDAARGSALRVVLAGPAVPEEFASLADEVTGDLGAAIMRERDAGRTVLAVGRPDTDTAAALLNADVCVAVTDPDAPVLWQADILVTDGLPGVWRLLNAVSAATTNGHRATTLAKSGAALAGLLVATRQRRRSALLDPVTAAGLTALLGGWWAGLTAGNTRPPRGRRRVAWHELSASDALTRLTSEARPPAAPMMGTFLTRAPLVATGLWLAREVRAELDDPLTPVLAVGAAASAVVGSGVDAMLVTGAMAMNAVTGGVQRLRARQALDRLRDSERPRARVARSRSTMDAAVTSDTVLVDATDLAVGDVISVRVGDVVPADGRLISVTDLEIDESTLTGESLPRAKQVEPTPAAAVPDRSCMVFAGTTVVSGEGRAVVTATGDDTVSGRAAALAVRADPATGIQARLHELTRTALPWTAVGGALVTVMSLLRGNGMRASVAGGVAVAVAAVPEGLPLVATVAQLAAARRLARRGILVRAPRALEAMGRLDVVCFDKTGTLTENRLRVTRLAAAHGSPCPADDPSVAHVVRIAGRSCPPGADSVARQHATDDAVIRAAGDDPRWHPLDARPFTAERGYSAVLGENGDERVIAVKGAPEVVLPACADASDAPELAERLSREGLRVLAVARRACADAELPDDVLSGLEFVGFVGLADTPRDSAQPLVSGLRDAGVRPVMLTGDHPSTAHAIAVSLGWPQDCGVITGDELATMNRQARAAALVDVDVVARVAPEQKLQVIEALREAGKVVAMIGDGANDAAAIRAASVGIGVRARGSTAARNAADLVLTDDELTRLLDAVSEGKALWRSVADAVAILLGGNAGEVGFTVLGTMLGGRSPLSTRQLLLVNLLTDMFPAMAVAVTRPDDEPVDVEQSLAHDVRSRGITTGIGATVAWLAGVYTPGTARRTSTIALAGLVGSQLARTVVRRWHSPLVLGTVVGSAAVLAVIIQTPGVSHFFGCVPLGPVAWAGVAAGVGAATVAPLVLPLGESGPLPEARAA